MTPNQIHLIHESWVQARQTPGRFEVRFYERLFELDPALRRLFKSDMNEQGRKLMEMLHLAVNGLFCLDDLVPEIEELGRRHREYGVDERHYDLVGEALLGTLAELLGRSFTLEVETAWTETYCILAEIMKAAADTAVSSATPPGE